ncbi:S26 family signal peptidase [Natrinema caseinilyticum]|uniref:S26 family signal peptidase n=1 Tax=Natrinema caseinilyticum TaxID=2961570 RepID=UPI0020C40078|nr:S26 family signal peptidase [Natrinema caseinilyticum]
MDGSDETNRSHQRASSRDDRHRFVGKPSGGRGDVDPSTKTRPRDREGERIRIEDGIVRWLLESDALPIAMFRTVAMAIAIIGLLSLLLFGISGQLPVLVAVESGSMQPNMQTGDLVFLVEEGRFAGDGAVAGTGVVTLERGRESGHRTFNSSGDVIVFRPNGNPAETPVIHRVHFYVEDGENWVQTKADPNAMNGATCVDIPSCPAAHDGFVTKGDANDAYDQLPRSGAETTVVRPDWVTGKAMVRIPWVGQIRLAIDSVGTATGVGSIVIVATSGAIALVLFGMAAGTDEGGS